MFVHVVPFSILTYSIFSSLTLIFLNINFQEKNYGFLQFNVNASLFYVLQLLFEKKRPVPFYFAGYLSVSFTTRGGEMHRTHSRIKKL